ncbi:YqgE/AlgH family protein [Microvirga pudoricolor]|uniref:YqgE/AlgH family protein n=1 Tax=Microvirga pudoricolor TaxID=2778729 RepID=UPI00194E9C0C|nr:YqgE/AlgH family protein [Microvirga pudoricolor]MBM6592674.1 YqgE/AlgH family protein [Microvirga pudoricolor]
MPLKLTRTADQEPSYLEGQLLIAMPSVTGEPFSRSLVYVCAHSAEGAMGIVLNRPATNLNLPDLLVQLEIVPEAERIALPKSVGAMQVLMGGPVETSRGFVLHSPDYHIAQSTLPIDDGVCLTATVDILRAIAQGRGPSSAVLALGYAGWQAGQLENEIQANGWLTCPANPDLIFTAPIEARYELAMRHIGINPAMLSMEAGHA